MVDIHSYSNDSGIYSIYIDNILVYVGRTKNFHMRFNAHTNNIQRKENFWYPLVREFDKRGHSIVAKILETVPMENIVAKELDYIIKYNPIFNKEGCPKGKVIPTDYDAAIKILGISYRPPMKEIKIE